MKELPILFSIVIPAYNRSELIAHTIKSILNQDFKAIEVIIVDDGSTDKTEEVVAAYQDNLILYFKIPNSERGAARNFGLAKAKGKYVNYFDSDDLYLPCLSDLAEFINKNNFPDVIYGSIQHVEVNGALIKTEVLPYGSFTKNLLYNNFLACGAVFLKSEVAKQFLFHEDRRLSSAEDWELWLRIHTRFEFLQFPADVFQQVHHQKRSLNSIPADRIEVRDNYFADLVIHNQTIKEFYGKAAVNLFRADRFTFIALAFAGRERLKSISYLRKALFSSFFAILRKRFWASLKNNVL